MLNGYKSIFPPKQNKHCCHTSVNPSQKGTLFVRFSSQFIGVFIISTADKCFGLLILISIERKTKNSLKNIYKFLENQ